MNPRIQRARTWIHIHTQLLDPKLHDGLQLKQGFGLQYYFIDPYRILFNVV